MRYAVFMRLGLAIILFFTLIPLLVACGKATDNEFVPYLELFRKEATARGVSIGAHVEIAFETTIYGGYAQCLGGGLQRIVVSEYWWSLLSALEREALLFHELGHCALAREHVADGTFSLMTRVAPGADKYGPRRSEYLDELFGGQ